MGCLAIVDNEYRRKDICELKTRTWKLYFLNLAYWRNIWHEVSLALFAAEVSNGIEEVEEKEELEEEEIE